jgi:hypothetical protein
MRLYAVSGWLTSCDVPGAGHSNHPGSEWPPPRIITRPLLVAKVCQS